MANVCWLVKDKADGTYLGPDGGWGPRDEALKYADRRQAAEAADARRGFGDSQPKVMRVTRFRLSFIVEKAGTHPYYAGTVRGETVWSQIESSAHVFRSRRAAERLIQRLPKSEWIVNPQVVEVSGER